MYCLKKTLLSLVFTVFLFSACEKVNEEKKINGTVISQSDCKAFKTGNNASVVADTLSCVSYRFNSTENKLLLTHQNTGFNCCPGEISCKISFDNDTILIAEFEETNACDCNCLFDIDIDISGIEDKVYFLKFIEPYCGEQEKLEFEIDLSNKPDGTYCAYRNSYPWGIIGN